ncbi:MAG: hypothetical protein L6R28_01750 [Planctomycetes bacterium]|nr:hypothetical protein [Planctomycetota bacterium]
MKEDITQLVRYEVQLAETIRAESDQVLEAPAEGAPDETYFSSYNFRFGAYLFAHLHRFKHSDNPHHKAEWCAELAMRFVDKFVEDYREQLRQGKRVSTGEWPHFITAEVCDWLRDKIPSDRKAAWLEHETAWAEQACERPFGFTAPNHDAWRIASLYRLGQALDRPKWCETALFLARQIIEYQTEEGFWEEGRHHGPSMRYCALMLSGLAWTYRLSGEKRIGHAARRLAEFMATYTFPDATTVGCFDGRQQMGLGFFPLCPGLELTPLGRTLNARSMQLWRDAGRFEDIRRIAPSRRNAFQMGFFLPMQIEYFAERLPDPERAPALAEDAPLPIERDGSLEHHSTQFDGLLHRRGPWVLALSSQNSDIPKDAQSVFRLERQSRIELWHANARLVIGGGHNLGLAPLPLANAVVDTGHAGAAEFGVMGTDDWHHRFRYYAPRLARSTVIEGRPELTLVFAHATIRFRFAFPDANRVQIDAKWETMNVQRLCLQLPLIAWRGSKVAADGEELGRENQAAHMVSRAVRIEGSAFGGKIRIKPPYGTESVLHYPLAAMKTYGMEPADDPFLPTHDLALLSSMWRDPARNGEAQWTVEVT